MAKRKAKRVAKRKVPRPTTTTAPKTVAGGDDENLTEKMVAAEFGFGLAWLRKKRVTGAAITGDAGPPFYKFGENVRYRRGDVRAYIQSRKVDRSKNALPAQPEQPSA